LARSFVPPPAQLIGPAFRARGNVEAAVLVEVGDDHGDGVGPGVFDGVHLPAGFWVAGVLDPDEAALGSPAGGDHVEVAVAVEIADGDGARLTDFVLDQVPLPLAAVAWAADVLEPLKAIAAIPARGSDVQIAVAVKVGQGDVVGTRNRARSGYPVQLPGPA